MKKSKYVWVALAFCLAACGADGAGKDNSKASVSTALGSSAGEVFDEQFAGNYALNASDCGAMPMAGTMSLKGKRFRLTETTCDMSGFQTNSNGDEMSVALTNCSAEGTAQSDENIILKRVEEGVELSGYDGRNLLMNFCGK